MNKTIGLFMLSVMAFSLQADELVEDELIGIYGSEEFISIATGYQQSVKNAPAVASVIDADEIRKMGARDLDEVLETIPGLHVSYSYQGYFPIYTFRGIYSGFNPQVLLLIDGVPQTNLFTGGKNFVWGGLSLESVDRIEIIRGPGSAIYGADAFAGVINIQTKDNTNLENSSEVGTRYGTFNTRSAFGTFKRAWNEFGLFFGIQALDTDGQDAIIASDLQSFLDSVAGTSASKAPGEVSLSRENLDLNLGIDMGMLSLRALYQGRRDWGTGAGITQALDPSGRYKSDRLQLSFEYAIDDLAENLDLNISGSYLDVTQENEDDAVLFPEGSTGPFLSANGEPIFGIFPQGVIGNPEVYEKHTRINGTLHYRGVDKHDLTLGTGYYYGDLYKVREEKNYCTDEPSCEFIASAVLANNVFARAQLPDLTDVSDTPFVFLREGDRRNTYLYLQDIYTLANDWQLTAGVRFDHYSDFGDTVNPRLALVWSTSNNVTTKFIYGEAFRAPSFQETRAINNPAVLGNPDLQPETLRSYEIVTDITTNRDINFVVNTFYYEWEDIILFVADEDGGTSTAQNAGRQTGYGIEFESNWEISPYLTLSGNFSWQKSTNTRTSRDVANAPGRQLFLRADWEVLENTHLNLQANRVMDRTREELDTRSEIDDYTTIDLALRKTDIWQTLEAAIIIKNLFDEDAREPSPNGFPVAPISDDLPLSGRIISGEVRYSF